VDKARKTGNASSRGYQLADPLQCVECGTLSSLYAWGWRGYRIDDPSEDELPALAFYCPSCAADHFAD
jgi:hypothetical protein